MSRSRPNAFSFTVRRCDITLPHLNYTLKVRRIKAAEIDESTKAYVERHDRHSCTLHLPSPCAAPMAAHEVLHAIQFLFRDRHIDFLDETEHAAYIMQYALGRVMGMVWVVKGPRR